MTESLNVLFVSSEVVGFAKTGGLADVCRLAAARPRPPRPPLRRRHAALPRRRAWPGRRPRPARRLHVPLGDRVLTGRLWRADLPGSDVPVYLVEQPDYFERDDPARGGGLYQFAGPDGRKRDYADNCDRFVVL